MQVRANVRFLIVIIITVMDIWCGGWACWKACSLRLGRQQHHWRNAEFFNGGELYHSVTLLTLNRAF